ncbi:hypothetical protein [Pedobacter sp.]|uniref:hypothetical protein n=1 Tax=Pedobacter sp. TaxID=1411316 RepID=UPI0031D97531
MQLKNIIRIGILLICPLCSWGQQVWTDHNRLLPDKLRGLPSGIQLGHSPTPVYPELNTDTVNYPGKYIWKHLTQVSGGQKELTVIEAGSFIWRKDKGWAANIRLDNASFADRFHCKNGVLKKGKTYTFEKNWRFGDQVYAGDALWFVIAKDAAGNLFKGIAVVETEGSIKK